jgi:signal transduction histidine kinase
MGDAQDAANWQSHRTGSDAPAMEDESKRIGIETVARLRTLAHDLSNSIETVMQASYLLAQSKLDDSNQKWLQMIDSAAQEAAKINREIREILRSQA